ncbi:MAG: type II toxin-antitoxin system HipA family toxin YjjJ [Moraxellaceae bacterium]|nr:type II toxin-antitoxin system HipA family toxin YjjJ [Moraxellaceae bacterium]
MARPSLSTPGELLSALAGGSCSRAELQARLGGISQPTVSRLVRAAGERVRVLGRGADTRYGATRSLPRLGSHIPLYRVDQQGDIHVLGALYPLAGGECWCEFNERAGVLHPGLPHFLQDMRPQGFMGRAFASRYATMLGVPPRLVDWDDDVHLLVMALFGDDLSGNLVVGDESLRRLYAGRSAPVSIPTADRTHDYARKAEASLLTEPGSSAGGEQPKFTHAWQDGSGIHHVLVKFSPAGDAPAALRWRDLLRAEHLALELLRENGIAAAATVCIETGGRVYLESERFDRVGATGRRGLLSLEAVSLHRHGRLGSWSDAAGRLLADHLITEVEARTIRLLDLFGALIANTDRHFGNLSLFIDDFRYALAPAYDMLPMLYRPVDGGELPAREFTPPMPTAANADVWHSALAMATAYWQRLSTQPGVSPGFQQLAGRNADSLARLAALQPPRR